MSNIYTSFIRIKRRDGQELSEQEIEQLFRGIVNVHGEFGSYWVRIVKKYREAEKCLDIQFGSGKRVDNSLTDSDIFNQYYAVERINYEGSLDRIFEYRLDKGDEFATETEHRLCKYAFDKIIITADENWLEKEGAEHTSSTSQELNISGTYHSSNCKSFTDLFEDSEYYGPCLGYADDYPYDYFVLKSSDWVEFLSPPFLAKLSKTKFERMPNNSKLAFLYHHRTVLTIHKIYDRLEIQTADHWDNCADELYRRMNP